MKNILFVNTYYYPNGKGGAEKSTKILAESFAKRGFRVSVITTSDTNYTLTKNGVDIYYVKMGNLYWLQNAKKHSVIKRIFWHLIDSYGLNNTLEFEAIIKKINPDIVLTNNLVQFSSKIFKIISTLNTPILHIIRDHYLMNMTTVMSKDQFSLKLLFTGKILSVRKKQFSNYVNGVVGISEYIIHKHLENNYFKNAVIKAVIPNALTACVNRKVISKDREPVFGYVGALNPRKGVDFILETFTSNSIKNDLLIFGSGSNSYIQKLSKFTKQYSNIHYCGYEKPEVIFQKIDCLIVPSLINEAFGRVIIEAYSYGIPVVGSNRGGIPELVDVGKTGYLFDPDINDSLTNIIKINLLDKSIDLGLKKNAYEKSKLYSEEKIINQYLEIFSKLRKVL